jgi:hypothetical protein
MVCGDAESSFTVVSVARNSLALRIITPEGAESTESSPPRPQEKPPDPDHGFGFQFLIAAMVWLGSACEMDVLRHQVIDRNGGGAQLSQESGDLPAMVGLMVDHVEEDTPQWISPGLAL